MTYAELLEEVKEKKVAKLIEYEVCTPKIAKDLLEKISKCEEAGEDASSDAAKEVLKLKDSLKAASDAEGGDWTEPIDEGAVEIFEQLEKWECKMKENQEVRVHEVEGMIEYVEKKWTGLSKLGKFTAAVLEKAKPLVEAVKQKNKELEQDKELRDAVFMMDLVNGVVTTYALIGFTIPEFVIQGSDEVEVQLEKRIPRWEAGRDIDKESELGKKIQAQIEKLQEAMPQIQLICKENPKFSFEDQRECKETINMKATLFAGAACAIKGNTEELAKMIAKAEEEFKKGEASFFDTEAKKKILTKAQYDSALEKLKEKAQELEKKAKEETKTEETKPAAEPKPEEKKGAAETAPEGVPEGLVRKPSC